jgi:hypothetical protein
MTKKIWYLNLFLLTFLIGSLAAWLMLRGPSVREFKSSNVEPTKIENSLPTFQIQRVSQPKIFKVKSFEEKFVNQPNIHFIELGEVTNAEDFKIKSGETWLGLFGNGSDYNLRQTKVRLRNFRDDDLNWTDILVKGKEKPIFLVKNLKNVKAGEVTTLFHGTLSSEADENNQTTAIEKDFFKEFKLGEQTYTLRVEQGLSEDYKPIAVLLLETKTESQIIDVVWNDGEWVDMGNLYWVGDLDSDGKLDLYKDFWNYEKGYSLSGIFLSSKAKKGQLVKRFEFLAFGGC